jgi:inositol-hexakisphosphate 5-kinase
MAIPLLRFRHMYLSRLTSLLILRPLAKVWNHVTQSYVTQNKYTGREVRTDDFPAMLGSFLRDGERLLVYHIPSIIQKLYALAGIIKRLDGYRFYGCSLLFIYDGDREAQESYHRSVSDCPHHRKKRAESLGRKQIDVLTRTHHEPSLRRIHSEDLMWGPVAKRSHRSGRRKRGEVNIRIVDFAHTTSGKDYVPIPPNFDKSKTNEVASGGYQANVDPESNVIYARFPPHHPDQPDLGFLFGIKNLTETLEHIWEGERTRRLKMARDRAAQEDPLFPLSCDGKEVFDELFGTPNEPTDADAYIST